MRIVARVVAAAAGGWWLLALQACQEPTAEPATVHAGPTAEAQFVGRDSCIPCHETANRLWQGSHHDLAMQEANDHTVLGDFDDATFTYNGRTSTFYRRDDRFFVRTDGADGELQEYPIAYTFGAVPLQQYLIEFPDGRLQALGICWDTRPAADGGQRWFHLYPDEEIDFEDPLHWTGIHQNWNYMCAECHSTQVRKGYDLATRSFTTTWTEIDVSCEACHGPGSEHVSWARAANADKSRYDNGHYGLAVRLEDPGRGTWLINPETGSGMRLAPPVETREIDTCARCHSRRSLVSEDYRFGKPIMDTHRIALLEEGLYHADGQILEEVYVYGSFLQSKMYHRGVTCVDCHDAHSAQLHFPGDAVCFRCHSQVEFASRRHHFHQPGTNGSFCVDCHMPPQTYMVVDPRHDHSLRVPRPDLSLELGTPNACNACHGDKSVGWSVDWIEKWYGEERRREPRYGTALAAARRGAPDAERQLRLLIEDPEVPAIVKATALEHMGTGPGQSSERWVAMGLRDPDPLVRMGALQATEALATADRLRLTMPMLSDPVRTVRVAAVSALAGVPAEAMAAEQRSLFLGAVEEYRQAQLANAERPEAHLNLGWMEANLGNREAAASEYRVALELDPTFIPAYVNLADLYRALGQEAESERTLRQALAIDAQVAEVHHALGLALIRQARLDEALAAFGRAVELAPDQTRFAYVYAVALHDAGEVERSIQVLERAHEQMPAEQEVLFALVSYLREIQDLDRALFFAEKLLSLDPTNADLQGFVQQIRSASR